MAGVDAKLADSLKHARTNPMSFVFIAKPDAPRYTVCSRSIPRSDADFLPAVTLYLRKYYDLQLGAAAIEGMDEPFPLARPRAAQAGNPFAIDLFPKPPPATPPPAESSPKEI
jgi:hypothetical protein